MSSAIMENALAAPQTAATCTLIKTFLSVVLFHYQANDSKVKRHIASDNDT